MHPVIYAHFDLEEPLLIWGEKNNDVVAKTSLVFFFFEKLNVKNLCGYILDAHI